MDQGSLYLGFDLSTQQLKGIAVRADLKVVHQAKFDFDADSVGYGTTKGVLTNEEEHEVYAPVAAFLQALDGVLHRLKEDGLDFRKIRGVSGAGMQHGSVYWTAAAEEAMQRLDPSKPLECQLDDAFSYPYSPNWQDASTQVECDEFDKYLGDEEQLAIRTGSKAHHVRHLTNGTWRRRINVTIEIHRPADPEIQTKASTGVCSYVTYFACIFVPGVSVPR